MVIVDQRSPPSEDFVLFPFTHPVQRRRKVASRSSGVPSEGKTDDAQLRKHLSMVKATEPMSGLDAAFGFPNSRILKGQQYQYEDYESEDQSEGAVAHARDDDDDDAEWEHEEVAEFLATEQERLNSIDSEEDCAESPGELSRESILVQVGQPDTYGSELESIKRDKELEAMNESHDDAVYGPVPAVRPEVTHDHEPEPLVNEEKQEKTLEPATTSRKGRILMMVTNMGMNRTQVQNQQRATMLLNALSIPYDTIDGSDPVNKDVRNELFKLSDMRGMYPQFFVVGEGDDGEPQTTFLGDWETIEGINDSSSLPIEILEANPTLLTWDRIPGLVFK